MSESKIKRVRITESNYELAKVLADKAGTSVADYLDYIVNNGLVMEANRKKQSTPLYVWKS